MPVRKFDGFIVHTAEDATFHFPNEKYVFKECKLAFKDNEKVTFTVSTRYNKRSLKQNSLFHAYVGILADEFGYDSDTMKELIRLKWLKETLRDNNGDEMVDTTTGEIMFRLRSTTELNTLEMAELTEEIRIWAMQGWNIVLPLPGDNLEMNF